MNAIGPGSVEAPAFGPDPRGPRASEQSIHQTIATFLTRALPAHAWHTALDSAGKASYVVAARLKARGGRRGVPDHLVLCSPFPAIFFEVKTDKGRLSPEQEQTASAIIGNGQHWFLVRSPDDVEAALRSINVPLRATLGEIRGRIAEQNARIKPARNQASAGEYQHVEQRNCPRCGGTGRREEGGDAHRSPGIVPCDHRVWIPATRGRKRSGGGFGGGGDSKARVRKAAAIYARVLLGQ